MSDDKPMRLPQLRLHYEHKREGDESSDSSETQTPATAVPIAPRQERKRPRYLSDIDRSLIIQRLEKGEKQADLAREFGVTRAAICHINKNKDEVLTRFDEFARSPHGRVLIENYSRPSSELDSVVEVRTASATVLMTRIKDKTTTSHNFRAAADRLIRLLLEEALVSFGSAESFTSQGIELTTIDSPPCAVALEREGTLMMEIFTEMEPEAPTGSIGGAEPYGDNNATHWQVLTVDLPDRIAAASVLLLTPIVVSASFLCAAVEELRGRGVQPSSIGIVCISCAFEAAQEMANRHPDVTIITATLDRQSPDTSEPLEEFMQRYYASITESDTS